MSPYASQRCFRASARLSVMDPQGQRGASDFGRLPLPRLASRPAAARRVYSASGWPQFSQWRVGLGGFTDASPFHCSVGR